MIEINYSLILQIICVIFLYLILSKFLFSKILLVLEERRSLIEGNRETSSLLEKDNKEKERRIQETLESCKRDMSERLQQSVSEKQKEFSTKMSTLVEEGNDKMMQVKSELAQDMNEFTAGMEEYSSSIYQTIMKKLGVA